MAVNDNTAPEAAAIASGGLRREPLTPPRMIRLTDGREALFLAWIVGLRGNRICAEVVTHAQYVALELIPAEITTPPADQPALPPETEPLHA